MFLATKVNFRIRIIFLHVAVYFLQCPLASAR